ncbi:MAG: TonB-dependent receptor [Bacteroidetes bacterium]|nr:TonB-dependent receptor [Bacteroidota bacterium]
MKKNLQFIFLFCLAFGQLLAQTNPDTLLQLPDVEVAERRISLPMSEQDRSIIVIGRKQIELAPAASLNALLQYCAGVDVRQRGANGVQADIGIRGSGFDQVLVLVNGIKVSDLQTGHHSLNLPVDIENIERIEVLKGPSARIFGQNAFAGAINIVTRTPDEPFFKAQVTAGQNGLWGGKLSGAAATGKLKHYLSATYDESDGYRYNSDYRIANYFYQNELQTGDAKWQALAGLTTRRFGANGFYASPDFKEQHENVETSFTSLKFQRPLSSKAFLKSCAYWRRNEDEYILLRNDPSYYRNLHTTNNFGADANLSISTGWGQTGIGLDINRLLLSSTNLGDRNRNVVSLFAEQRLQFLQQRLSLTPGIQFNYYSDFGANLLPGIDLGLQLTPKLRVFANWGYTYRVPTFTDLYYADPNNLGNPDLNPEFAQTWEAGLKTTRWAGIEAQASYFIRLGTDIIDWTKAAATDPWMPANLIGLNVQGIDFNFAKQWQPSSLLQRIDLGYTYLHAKTQDTDPQFSRYALENLRHQFIASVVLRYLPGLTHSFQYRYCNRVNLEDYHLLDSRISYTWKKLTVFMEATNLFDVKYRETNLVPMPGRWLKGGISYVLR